jgi:trans-aconitate methyltransferase
MRLGNLALAATLPAFASDPAHVNPPAGSLDGRMLGLPPAQAQDLARTYIPDGVSQNMEQGVYPQFMELPKPEEYEPFLASVPSHGNILDFGSGTGNFAAAFAKDRPDTVIDTLDVNIPALLPEPENWRGDMIINSFQNFAPSHKYDGVWANKALYFLPPEQQDKVFGTLAEALNPQGIIDFDYPVMEASKRDFQAVSDMLKPQGKYPRSTQDIVSMIENAGLDLVHMERETLQDTGTMQIYQLNARAQKPD